MTTQTRGCWKNMIRRCTNPKASGFRDYGGRGISVCDRWFDYNNFGDYALLDYGAWPWLWWFGQAGVLIFVLIIGTFHSVKPVVAMQLSKDALNITSLRYPHIGEAYDSPVKRNTTNSQSRAMGGDKLVSGKFDLFVNAANHQEGTDSQQKGDDSKWVRPLFPRGFWLALIVAAGFGWLIGGVIYK